MAPCFIYLVQDRNLRLICQVEVGKNLLYCLELLGGVLVCYVNYVQEQVGLGQFLECGSECGNYGWRQFVDKANGISEQKLLPIGQKQASGDRVQGRKKLVFCQHISLAQGI